MNNFKQKTIKEIYDGFISQYTVLRNNYNDTSPLLEKAVVKSIGYSLAALLGTLWAQILWVFKQCFPHTCCLSILKLWGSLVGVEYKTGETANLKIELNNVTASYLPTGTVYKDLKTGLIFKTVSQTATEKGKIITTVICSSSGSIGNLSIDSVLNIANPYEGIPSSATVTDVIIEGSSDEDVETYRKRVLYKFRFKSQGGSALDYYNWAMEVPGIVDVFPYVLEEGIVSVYLVAEGSGINRTPSGSITPNPFPNWIDGEFKEYDGSGQFLQVAKAIEGSENKNDRRPLGATVNLLAPVFMGFTVKITGLTDISYNEQIKNILINTFDQKRPHIKVLGYVVANAKISRTNLSSIVYEILDDQTFTDFELFDSNGNPIIETTLGIGSLAYLNELYINGSKVTI